MATDGNDIYIEGDNDKDFGTPTNLNVLSYDDGDGEHVTTGQKLDQLPPGRQHHHDRVSEQEGGVITVENLTTRNSCSREGSDMVTKNVEELMKDFDEDDDDRMGDPDDGLAAARPLPEFIEITTTTNVTSAFQPPQQWQSPTSIRDSRNDDAGTTISDVTGTILGRRNVNDDLEDTKDRYRQQISARMYEDEAHQRQQQAHVHFSHPSHQVSDPTVELQQQRRRRQEPQEASQVTPRFANLKEKLMRPHLMTSSEPTDEEGVDEESKRHHDDGKTLKSDEGNTDRKVRLIPMAEPVLDETEGNTSLQEHLDRLPDGSSMVSSYPVPAFATPVTTRSASHTGRNQRGARNCTRKSSLCVAIFGVSLMVIVIATLSALGIFKPSDAETGLPRKEPTTAPTDTFSPTGLPTISPTTIWNRDSMNWVQVGLDITSSTFADNESNSPHKFGSSVSISSNGRTIAVGAPGSLNQRGHVQVHQLNTAASNEESQDWTLRGQILYGLAELDQFGYALDLNDEGTILAISAIGHDNNVGHVRIFEYAGLENQWIARGSIIAGDGSIDGVGGNYFGRSLSLSGNGDVLAIGASKFLVDDNSLVDDERSDGLARVYEFDEKEMDWKLRGSDLPYYPVGNTRGQELGASIALSSDGMICLVGVPTLLGSAGGIIMYRYLPAKGEDQGFWEKVFHPTQESSLRLFDEYHGATVALAGNGHVGCARTASGILTLFNYYEDENYFLSDLQSLDITDHLNSEAILDDGKPFYGGSISMTQTSAGLVLVAWGSFERNNMSLPGIATIHSYAPDSSSNQGTWKLIGSHLSGGNLGDRFGESIAISKEGSVVAIGAGGGTGSALDGDANGYVRVFVVSQV